MDSPKKYHRTFLEDVDIGGNKIYIRPRVNRDGLIFHRPMSDIGNKIFRYINIKYINIGTYDEYLCYNYNYFML